jgi:broad specificity phosphatase PhoE
MKKLLLLLTVVFLFSCKTTTWYISRHAEKADNSANPQLSAEGQKQALDLRDYLTGKNIKKIYATNFIRTQSTAQPTSQLFTVAIQTYTPPAPSSAFIDSLKAINSGNALVVGHSNTVDDIVNGLMGTNTMTDIPETEYGSLFIVKRKGSNYSFQKITVPRTTPR